jgi:hypothetical protein
MMTGLHADNVHLLLPSETQTDAVMERRLGRLAGVTESTM